MWLPEQPQAGAHEIVAAVAGLSLAKPKVPHIYGNGAISLKLFDQSSMTFSSKRRLPPPRTVLEAEQRLFALTSIRPHWVGQRVRLLNHGLVPLRYSFNALHYGKYVERCGGLQTAFDAGRKNIPEAAYGWGTPWPCSHEMNAQLQQRGMPRIALNDVLLGSTDGSASEIAVIIAIDLHARCELPPCRIGEDPPVDRTWGTADVQCFDPYSMEYCGVACCCTWYMGCTTPLR